MKNSMLFIALFFCCSFLKAQQTCVSAVNTTPAATCNYSTHTTTGTEYWLKFVASSPTVNISLITTKFVINAPHVHNLALLTGVCGNQILIAEDELPFVADANELAIDLNASGLVIGQTYYIRAIRFATEVGRVCDKVSCTANGSTDPTTFDICVQDIDVIIPLDFGLEQPSISHAYTTNRGQLVDINGNQRPEIKLYTLHTNPAVYIADDKISYVFSKLDTSYTIDSLHRVDMRLVGANTGFKSFKTEQVADIGNFYYPHVAVGVTGNKSYSRAVCNEIYQKIDMQYYSNQDGLKYYFIVKPGGDPDNIVMKFDGATAINVTPTGGLEIVTSLGVLDFEPPHAYRINPAGNPVPMPWQAKFEAIPTSANTVKFKTHPYDPIMPLFIQVDRGHSQFQQKPANGNLDWSTYFNGNSADFSFDVTNDDVGNTYMVGKTQGNNFPTLNGQFTHQGQFDGFISRFDAQAKLEWSTYYGGSADEGIYEVSFNSSNQDIYAIGNTSSTNIPIAPSFNPNNGSFYQNTGYGLSSGPGAVSSDAFVLRISNSGFLNWATYFGGAGNETGVTIKCDPAGHVYVAGTTRTSVGGYNSCKALTVGNFPLCDPGSGAYHQSINAGNTDIFYAIFDQNNFLLSSTFFGSNLQDNVFDIGFKNPNFVNNGVYLVGSTFKTFNTGVTPCTVPTNGNFPLCNGGISLFYSEGFSDDGSEVAFISKFNLFGELKWSTLFPYVQQFQSVEVVSNPSDSTNELVFAAGLTATLNTGNTSTNQPISGQLPIVTPTGAYQQINNAGQNHDLFLTQFNKDNQLVWSTFFGSPTDEYSDFPGVFYGVDKKLIDIAANNSGNLYVMGVTQNSSAWSFVTNPHPDFYNQSVNAGGDMATSLFLAGFGKNLNNFWSSLFGGDVPNPGCPSGTYCLNQNSEIGTGLSVFNNESVYISGYTLNETFPQLCPSAPNPWCQFPLTTSELSPSSGTISRLDISGIVGIEEVIKNKDNSLFIYPNPATLQLTITSINNIEQIEIYNAIGQSVYKENIKNKLTVKTINVTNYSTGVYLVKVMMKDHPFQLKKLIIE